MASSQIVLNKPSGFHKLYLSLVWQFLIIYRSVVALDSGCCENFQKLLKICEAVMHIWINLQCYKLVTDLRNKFKNEQLFTWTDFIQTLKRALSFDEKKSRFHKSWNKCINSICCSIYNHPGYLWREQNVTVKKSKGKRNFWSYTYVLSFDENSHSKQIFFQSLWSFNTNVT